MYLIHFICLMYFMCFTCFIDFIICLLYLMCFMYLVYFTMYLCVCLIHMFSCRCILLFIYVLYLRITQLLSSYFYYVQLIHELMYLSIHSSICLCILLLQQHQGGRYEYSSQHPGGLPGTLPEIISCFPPWPPSISLHSIIIAITSIIIISSSSSTSISSHIITNTFLLYSCQIPTMFRLCSYYILTMLLQYQPYSISSMVVIFIITATSIHSFIYLCMFAFLLLFTKHAFYLVSYDVPYVFVILSMRDLCVYYFQVCIRLCSYNLLDCVYYLSLCLFDFCI